MKNVLILALLLSCTMIPIEGKWTKNYINKKGYFAVKPGMLTEEDNQYFKRCKLSKIVGFEKKGLHQYILVEQDKEIFVISSLNNEYFSSAKKAMREFFVRKLHLSRRKVASGQTAKKKLCAGKTWVGMKKIELRFVLGKPRRIETIKSLSGNKEMWVYGEPGKDEPSYYYFKKDKLINNPN